MKRAHIVYAHPEPRSFVAAMRDTAVMTLREAGWGVSVSDLYANRFDPVARAEEFTNRRNAEYLVYALEQRHAVQTGTLSAGVCEEVQRVIESQLLVLVFPVFWFSVPAILKGWFDRVFLSGVFYGGRRVYDLGGMVGRKALVLAALGSREGMFGPGSIHGDLLGMLRHLLQGTLAYAGFDVIHPFFAYHVPYISDEERRNILQRLREHLTCVDTLPSLPMPSVADFNEDLLAKQQHRVGTAKPGQICSNSRREKHNGSN